MTMAQLDMKRRTASRRLSAARRTRKAYQLARDQAVLPVIVQGRERGLSWRRIAAQLTEGGFETPRGGAVWSGNAVMRIGQRHKVDERIAADGECAILAARRADAEVTSGTSRIDPQLANTDLRVWIDAGGVPAVLLTIDTRWWCRTSAHPDGLFAWAHNMAFPSRLAGESMGALVSEALVDQLRFEKDGHKIATLTNNGGGRIRLEADPEGPLAQLDGLGAGDWEVATRLVFNSWLSSASPDASI